MTETIAQSQNDNYAVSVGTSSTVLIEGYGVDQSGGGATGRGGSVNRPRYAYIHNADTASDILYIGTGSNLSTSNGLPIAAGDYRMLVLDAFDEIWAIASAAATPVRVLVMHGKGDPA